MVNGLRQKLAPPWVSSPWFCPSLADRGSKAQASFRALLARVRRPSLFDGLLRPASHPVCRTRKDSVTRNNATYPKIQGGYVVQRADQQHPHHHLRVYCRSAEVGAVPLLQGRHQLGEVRSLLDPNQQMVRIYEVSRLPGGELEQCLIPAATVQWLEHRDSPPATDCMPISARKSHRPPRFADFFNTPTNTTTTGCPIE